MTNKEAVKTLLLGMRRNFDGYIQIEKSTEDDFLYAIGMSVSVLMKQEEEHGKHCKCSGEEKYKHEEWHDAKIDPPEYAGLYQAKLYGNYPPVTFDVIYEGGKWFIPKSETTDHSVQVNVQIWKEK